MKSFTRDEEDEDLKSGAQQVEILMKVLHVLTL